MSVTKRYPAKSAAKPSGARTTEAGTKQAGAVKAARAGTAGSTASYILSAPKGARTLSHRRIKTAVEKVFRERAEANG